MHLLVGLALAAFAVWCSWRILERLGYPGWFGLLAIVPIVNLVGLFLLATQPWPKEPGSK